MRSIRLRFALLAALVAAAATAVGAQSQSQPQGDDGF